MMVLGADLHKSSHTLGAVAAATGELLGERAVGDRGFAAALDWARGLSDQRVWALEDCRWTSPASPDTVGLSGSYLLLVMGEGDTSREAASAVVHGLRVGAAAWAS